MTGSRSPIRPRARTLRPNCGASAPYAFDQPDEWHRLPAPAIVHDQHGRQQLDVHKHRRQSHSPRGRCGLGAGDVAHLLALVTHGFDAVYNAAGTAGNQRAMLYMNEGLRNRAVLADVHRGARRHHSAAVDNHGGEDVCRLWTAFAAFGLGANAASGGKFSIIATNGFDVQREDPVAGRPDQI